MSNIASVLQPTKFLLIMLQIILLSMIIDTADTYIYRGIVKTLSKESEEYQQAYRILMGLVGVFTAFMIIEFIVLFSGKTLFYDKPNIIQIVFHVMGCIATAMFILNGEHYQSLYKIWIVGGIIPLAIEFCSLTSALAHFKKVMKTH